MGEGAEVDERRACLVALASLPGVGPATLARCLDAEAADRWWKALRSGRGHTVAELAGVAARAPKSGSIAAMEQAAARLDPVAFLERHHQHGIEVVLHGEAGYPQRLAGDPAAPAVLFIDGDLAAADRPTVAIVGTRNATRVGCELAGRVAVELAACGVSVVSGLALGIDGAAHRAMVDRPAGEGELGRPIAVVATGLDLRYPRRHRLLHDRVAAQGVVISEVPLGGSALPWRFPARNRIIAGLADVVVVVESRSTGGSMLTAAEALTRDRPILAVPGHPTSPAAAGTLDLICDGAMPMRDTEDVLVALGMGGTRPTHSASSAVRPQSTDSLGRQLLDELDVGPRTLAELTAAGGGQMDAVAAALVALEDEGWIRRSGPWFERGRS